jgi:Lipoprotein signal peptidase
MWLIVTGAIGNAFDYWRYGHVIDFLHFTFWGSSFPVFNLADAYITLGAISLFLLTRAMPRAAQT